MEKKEKMSTRRRWFLIVVGYLALALDRLEGKRPEKPPVTSGRIDIVE